MQRNIFKKRVNLKPYEYPELMEYVDAIRHSYWLHTEFNYSSDIQDLKVNLSSEEAAIVKKAMLAIAQIEVNVKTFWSKIYDWFPKPEFQAIAVTFGESEVRHTDAYSNLLELVGLNHEFEELMDEPAIARRIQYFDKMDRIIKNEEDFFRKAVLFSMFIENVSLFSQFLIMMSFNKYRNALKGISNAVEATSKEEDIHARFGFEIVNLIKEENPKWWNRETQVQLYADTQESYEAEMGIIDWIYNGSDLDFLPKQVVKEFVADRFNQSLKAIGLEPMFAADTEALKHTAWFVEETLSTKNIDFFVKRSVAYSKKLQSFTEDDLF